MINNVHKISFKHKYHCFIENRFLLFNYYLFQIMKYSKITMTTKTYKKYNLGLSQYRKLNEKILKQKSPRKDTSCTSKSF